MSRTEELLRNVLGEENEVVPDSRVEKLIANMNGGTYEVTPQSRVEELLQAVIDAGGSGSTLGEATFAEPGIYEASSYNMDGFSKVYVRTYHTSIAVEPETDISEGDDGWSSVEVAIDDSIAAALQDRYPKAIFVFPTGGTIGNGTTHQMIMWRGIIAYAAFKSYDDRNPDHGNSGSVENWYTTIAFFKGSSNTADDYSVNAKYDAKIAGTSASHVSSAYDTAVLIRSNTEFSLMVKRDGSYGSSYGFIPGVEYEFHVVYSEGATTPNEQQLGEING